MASVSKQERLTAPVVLAVIAGGIMLVGGMVSLGMMIGYHTMYGGHRMLGMMMYNGLQSVMPQVSFWIIGISASAMMCGAIILYSSYKMHTVPQETISYGWVVLAVSIAAIFAGNGFWLGSVLGIIAGIIAVSRKQQ